MRDRAINLNGYIAHDSVDATLGELGLQASATGNVTLRVTGFDSDRVRTLVAGSALRPQSGALVVMALACLSRSTR